PHASQKNLISVQNQDGRMGYDPVGNRARDGHNQGVIDVPGGELCALHGCIPRTGNARLRAFANGRSPDVIEDLTRVYNYEHTPRVVAQLPIADNFYVQMGDLMMVDHPGQSLQACSAPTHSGRSQPNLRSNTDVSSWYTGRCRRIR